MESRKNLFDKLNQFIRKYYINQLVKGVVLTLLGLIVFFILIAVLEHYIKFDVALRTIDPQLTILAPIRDNNWSREEQLLFLNNYSDVLAKDENLFPLASTALRRLEKSVSYTHLTLPTTPYV